MKRKFINFTNNELNRLAEALEVYGDHDLLKQVNQEMKTRAYNRKQYEEWQKNRPTFYCC